MKNQTNHLFKPEVYEAMQKALDGHSKYRGAEEAFEMFYADKKLQDFLREYAKKEDIIEMRSGYTYPPKSKFSQAGKDRHILLISEQERLGHNYGEPFGIRKSGIYLGPRQNGDAAIMIYTHLGDIIPQQTSGSVAGEIIKDNTWKIKCYTYFGGSRGDNMKFDGNSFPVSQAPLFQRISKQDILSGLEKAIEQLLRTE